MASAAKPLKKNGKVMLMSRTQKSINLEYPELVTALEQQKADDFIIDGEIIALKGGLSSFELLQSRINLQTSLLLQDEKSVSQ